MFSSEVSQSKRSGLADAGFSAQQDEAAGHDAAAQYAVEFGVAGVDARFRPGGYLSQRLDGGGFGQADAGGGSVAGGGG